MKARIFSLVSLLASCSFARPQIRSFADDDTILQRSKVTAFVVTDEGKTVVECWEIGNLLPDPAASSKGPTVMHMANNELEGVDILTWPSYAPIWPDPGSYSGSEVLSDVGSLFSVSSGLLGININYLDASNTNAEEWPDHVFSLENGDDWFYFEDQYTGTSGKCAHTRSDTPPLTIASRSASDTTVFQFKYKSTPQHKVLHAGACKFTGLVAKKTTNQNRLTVQK